MTAQLTKIAAAKPDAIICWGTNPGPAVVTRNVKQLGIKIPLYMSHGVASKKYIELAGADAAEGVMLPAGKLAVYDKLKKTDPQAKLLKEYDQAYRKAYGVEASTFGGYAYDGFQLIVEAIKKSRAPLRNRSATASSRPANWSASPGSSPCPPPTTTAWIFRPSKWSESSKATGRLLSNIHESGGDS